MDNSTIYNAAYVINSVGKQLNSMFEHIEELVSDAYENFGFKDIKLSYYSGANDASDWMTTSYIYNYGIVEKKKKKETVQIGFQAVIFNEDEQQVVGEWQPTIRVLVDVNGPGSWDTEGIALHEATTNGYTLSREGTLWTWEDGSNRGCVYLIPLASIRDKEFLDKHIVKHAFWLAEQLAKGSVIDQLAAPSVACKFTSGEAGLIFEV